MCVGDFAADDLTEQDVGAASNCARQCEDFPILRVCPPTSADRAAGNGGRQCRYRADSGLQSNAVGPHKRQGFENHHCRPLSRLPNILWADRNSYSGTQTAATSFDKLGGLLPIGCQWPPRLPAYAAKRVADGRERRL